MSLERETLSTARGSPPPRRRLLINRNFALLAGGQAISNMGDFVYFSTVLVWVFELTHSAAAVSGVLIAQYLPIFLLGPVAGVFVDRWNRRTTMAVSDLVRAGVALLPVVAPLFLRLPAIYLSVFLIATFGRFFMPAKSGMLQVIVADSEQAQAAAISQATFALSVILGPGIGSPLYFLVGPIVACLINCASYLFSALSVLLIRAPREALHPAAVQRAGAHRGLLRPVLGELTEGFGYVVKTRVLLMVAILAFVGMLGAGALNALDIVFVSQRLHADPALYGLLMAAGGAGMLIGALVSGLIARRVEARYLLAGGVLSAGIGIIIYGLQVWFVAAVIINFIICIPQAGIEVGYAPLVLNSTPKTLMGRVEAVMQTVMFAASLISTGLAGYLGQFIPVYLVFIGGGILLTIAGLMGWFTIPPSEGVSTTEEARYVEEAVVRAAEKTGKKEAEEAKLSIPFGDQNANKHSDRRTERK